MPTALLAVSDLEGNLDHLLTFLQTHKVIDDQFDWSWGDNHLLFNGDSVDRGVQVTELLWFIRKLQRQSILSGGQVHFVLGNHDVMILANDKLFLRKRAFPTTNYLAKLQCLGSGYVIKTVLCKLVHTYLCMLDTGPNYINFSFH